MSTSLTTFSFPTPTLFGPGAIRELSARMQKLGIRRPLVVTDQGLLGTTAFRKLVAELGEQERDKRWFVYGGVHPNPIEPDVREAAERYRQSSADAIIAIGGGVHWMWARPHGS